MRQNRTATFCTVRQLPICEFYVALKPGHTENRQIKPNLLKYCKLRTASNPGQMAGVTDCPTNLAFFLSDNYRNSCPKFANILSGISILEIMDLVPFISIARNKLHANNVQLFTSPAYDYL